jgi:hypothetical protein
MLKESENHLSWPTDFSKDFASPAELKGRSFGLNPNGVQFYLVTYPKG